MGQINNTRLATSTPLNLLTGFPIFPVGTSLNNPRFPIQIGLGQPSGTTSNTIFNRTISLGFFRLTGTTTASVIAGAFFGFNLGYNVQGQTRNNGTASLTVSSDSAQGGLGFGVGIGVSLTLRVEENILEFSFRNGFTNSWRNFFTTSASVNIDLIDISLRVMRLLGVNVPLERLQAVRDTVGSGDIWGLFSSNSSQFASRGNMTLSPRVSVSANILPRIPVFGKVISGLKKIGGKVKAGPAINIIFPITIQIVRLTTEDGNYAFSTRSGGTFNFNGGPVGTLGPTVSSVQVTHSHTVGIEFGLELKASVSLWSVFSISGGVRVPLNLGVNVTRPDIRLGPFFTALRNDSQTALELPEVVWG